MANGTLAASQIEMLTQSGTGIVTIVPPATNTNRTLTLPDSTGTLLNTNGGTINGTLTVTGVTTLGNGAVLGVPTSGTLTNLTGLPLTTGVTGTLPVANGGTGLTSGTSGGVLAYTAAGTLASSTALAANALVIGGGAGAAPSTTTTGTGVLTFLGTPSSANLAAAVTDETGSGALVFATSPTLVTPALGTPSSGTVTNLTGTASININGTVGATTPGTGAFTTVSATTSIATGTGNGATAGLKLINGTAGFASGWGAIYAETITPSNLNFVIAGRWDGQQTNINTATGGLIINSVNNTEVTRLSSTGLAVTGTLTASTAIGTASGGTGLGGATPFTANGVVYASSTSALATGSALTFDGSKLDVVRSSTTTTAFDESVIRAINSGAATLNQRVDIGMRFQDGTYNGIGGISMIRESATARSGTLAFSPIDSSGNASNAMRLDSAGNLGLGVTPSAWQVNNRAIQVNSGYASLSGNNSPGTCDLSYNCYNTTSQAVLGWKYTNSSAAATLYQQLNGTHTWHTAPSGTANDPITFTQAMTLDVSGASGRLLVGLTSSLNAAGAVQLGGFADTRVVIDATSTQGIYFTKSGADNGTFRVTSGGNYEWYVKGAGSANMTLDTSGNLGIGTGTSSPRALLDVVNGNANSGGDYTSIVGFTGANQIFGADTGTLALQSNDTVAADMGGSLVFGGRYSGAGAANWAIVKGAKENATSGNVAGYLVFGTRPSGGDLVERARIDSSGNFRVGFGTSTTNIYMDVNHATGSSSGASFFVARYNGTQIGDIAQSGTTAVAYNTSSDYRLKNSIAPMTGALAKVAQLKPVTYKWNADGSDGEGFIAHELAEVVPQCVTGEKDAVDEEGNPKYQGIDTSFLVATLTAAIQEQQAIIESLKARLDAANL